MKKLVGYLLSLVLCVTTFSIFGLGYISPATPALALGCALVFLFCEFVNLQNKKGHLANSVAAVIVYLMIFTYIRLLMSEPGYRESGMSFLQWLLTKGDEATGQNIYLVSLGLCCITIFGFFVYYFTQVRYRVNLLLLVSLMPCVLYAKLVAEVDDRYLALIAMLNILAGIYHTRLDEKKEGEVKSGNLREGVARLFYYREKERPDSGVLPVHGLIFALTVVLIGAAIPRKDDAVFYDRFEDLFLRTGVKDSAAESDLSQLGDISGDADGYNSENPRRLFILRGDIPPYLKRHNFDHYDFERNVWYKDDAFRDMWRSEDYDLNTDESEDTVRLFEALAAADRIDGKLFEDFGITQAGDKENRDIINDELGSLIIFPVEFKAKYYLGAARMAAFSEGTDPSMRYAIRYYRDSATGAGILEKRMADLTLDESLRLLERAGKILERVPDNGREAALNKESVRHFRDKTEEAISYRDFFREENEKIPDSVRELADSLTEGMKNDWEKALRLQTFFHEGSFTYDLSYKAPDDSVEYFLNENRTGTCSDFASAYALLARSANLSVRYAEGFKAEEGTREGIYYVRESGSHSYPEVYIPLMGWRVFEPTVSAEDEEGFFEKLGLDIHMDFALISTVSVLAAALAILGIVLRTVLPLILDILFALSLLFTKKEDRPRKRYLRFAGKLASKHGSRILSLTPRELGRFYETGYPKRKRRIDRLKRLIEELEAALYM